MLLASLFFLAQSAPPDLSQKISLDVRGGNGKELGTALTNKVGFTFQVVDEASTDRYVIHVENQPLREVMSRIADAEHGEWLRFANDYELRRSNERVSETIAAHRAMTIRMFKTALDGYKKQLAEKPDFGDEAAHNLAHDWRRLGPAPRNGYDGNGYWERENKLQQGLPLGRALMRMIMAFSPEDLADLPPEQPTVFSSNPTPKQRQLPDEAMSALGELVNEQTVWEDAVAKYLPDDNQGYWGGMATQGHIRDVSRAVISMQKWDESSGIQAHLTLADKKDKVISETYLFVQTNNDRFQEPSENTKKKEPVFPLSDLDVSIAKEFSYEPSSRGKSLHLSDAAKAFFANPEKSDPLSSFAADGLIGIASQRHENVAAVLDDRSLSAFAYSINKHGMDPQVLDHLRAWGVQSIIEGDGWLTVAEQRPDRADEVRCDRAAFQKLLEIARTEGRLDLDAAAEYALSSDHFQENPIVQAYFETVGDGQAGRTLLQNDKNLLRFYGSLDSGQRANGDHISLATLSSAQVPLLEKIVYGNNSNLQFTMPVQPQPDENGEYENYWNTLARDPTYSLGSGIPPSGFLKMTLNKDRAILAHMHYGEWDQGTQTYNIDSLAWMIAGANNQDDGMNWTVVGMAPADRTLITFQFQYTDRISQYMELQDTRATGKESAFLTQLPDDLRKDLQKKIDDDKKQLAENARYYPPGINVGGNSGPPK